MKFCHYGGYLVGVDEWLPTETSDYFGAAYGFGSIGCNHLVCLSCKQTVRHALGYLVVPQVDPEILFSSPRWDDLKGAQPSAGETGRLYACACAAYVAHRSVHLDISAESDPDPVPAWRCAGHPSFVPPGVIAGVDVELSNGWSPLVAAHLETTSNLHPSVDRIPGFTLTRIFQALEGQDERRALGLAVGSCGNDTSLLARHAVALFFALNGDAPGLERVLDAWRADPTLYDEHRAVFGTVEFLKNILLDAIAYRIGSKAPGSDDLLPTWRWAALHGSGLGVHLYRAPVIDAEWTKEHVEQLIDLAPADWYRIVRSIHVEFPMRLVPGFRRAIAEGYTTREKVAAALTEKYGAKADPAIAAL